MILWIILFFIWCALIAMRLTVLRGTKGNKSWLVISFFMWGLSLFNICVYAAKDNSPKERVVEETSQYTTDGEYYYVEEAY